MSLLQCRRELFALILLLCCCPTFLLADDLMEHEKAVARIKKRGGQLTERIQAGKPIIKVDMKGTE